MATRDSADGPASDTCPESGDDGLATDKNGLETGNHDPTSDDEIERLFGSVPHIRVSRLSGDESDV